MHKQGLYEDTPGSLGMHLTDISWGQGKETQLWPFRSTTRLPGQVLELPRNIKIL